MMVEQLKLDVPEITPVPEGVRRPFWSVMIPTYNCTHYLVQTLESVLAQDPGIEEMQIEVIDDCSTKDDPETVVKELGKGRVSFFRHPQNRGAIHTFNTCIQRSKGEWVHILHGDDLVVPGFYNHLREAIEKQPIVGAAFCRSIFIDDNGSWQSLYPLQCQTPGILSNWVERIGVVQQVDPSAIVVKRCVYEQLGGFHLELFHAGDWEMWKRIAVHYPVWYEPQPLAYYRVHTASDSSRLTRTGANIANSRRAIEISELYLPKTIAQEVSQRSRENYAFAAFKIAKRMLTLGDLDAAIAQVWESLLCSHSPEVIESLVSLLTSIDSDQFLTKLSKYVKEKPDSVDSLYKLDILHKALQQTSVTKESSLQTIKYITIQPAVESIEGFMVPGQEEYLFNKVQSLPENAIIVEIGSYKGRSTVAMAYACVGTNRKIYCIDTWDGNDSDFPDRNFFDIWQQNVLKNDLGQYVTPLRGYSHEILTRWNDIAHEKAIDFIFIDGSHQYLDVLKDFELSFPLVKNGGWIAFHDVVHTWPGPERVWHELAKIHLINHEYSSTLACGQKLSSAITSSQIELSIHFFTIVLNGQPFIRYHIDILKQLPFKWHWHIVEGVADLKHDTAWSVQLGGHVSDEIHKNGRSHDGTTEYLDEIARQYPDQITIYRKPEGVFWDGKREMVNEPLSNIHEECLLWEIDADELWTFEQICTARQLFINNPNKTAAFYWCWYFVGENLIISTRNCYAQNPEQEWLRTWRYKPGATWAKHEPPILQEPLQNGQWRDVASVNPFTHQETEHLGLIFQHFAYVTKEQLLFKEQYYGYRNATSQWLQLQERAKFPVFLQEYFPWVGDHTQVDYASSHGVVPLVQRELNSNSWRFLQSDELRVAQIRKSTPKILVDGVFFQLYQTGIARVWRSLLQEWVNNGFVQHIIVLDRAGTAPQIWGIRYRTIPAYNYNSTDADREMLQQVCDEEGAHLFISTYYTTPITTPSVFVAHDMIPEIFGWDLSVPMWREKHHGIKHAAAYIAVSENTARDLVKYFPNISLDSITVAKNGVDHTTFNIVSQEKIRLFRNKYGIVKPYFILVGAGGDYKNSILFFQAFSQLAISYGFDIICTGSSVLAPEWRAYTSGSVVHTLQLSDQELATAYSGAVALVYPSKYEGFGMPIIEAMACGCPVITCPNASIPEVAGKAAIYVNDDDVDGLVNALCEVQKPGVRKSLIAAGLEQAKEFSWSKMADTVSSVLIETSLQFLNLKEINLIIFPDWSQPEEVLALELQQLLKSLVNCPSSEYMALLIDASSSVDDYAELLLSAVSMNLLMEDDLDVSEGLEISLVPQLGEMQWKALLPRIKARIVLEHENQQAIVQVKADTLPCYEVEKQPEEFFLPE